MSETVRFFTGFTFTMMSVRGFPFVLVCLLSFRISGWFNLFFLGWLYFLLSGLVVFAEGGTWPLNILALA